MIIYDCEIINAIPPKFDGDRIEGIEYCGGWRDFGNMGVSCIGVYDYARGVYEIYLEDNFSEFERLTAGNTIVGFNNISFDNPLLAASGIKIADDAVSYDLLREVWAAAGLGPEFKHPSHAGYGLDAICAANFGMGKIGNGALAPVYWQRRQYGKVINYCLNDIRLTKLVLDAVLNGEKITNPKDFYLSLILKSPDEIDI